MTSPVMASVSPMGTGTRYLLGPVEAAAANSYTQSIMWGAELAATAENSYARIRLDLYWPGVRLANVVRLAADGTSSPVRNCEPLPLSTAAVIYDHEAPLNAACTYRVSPYGDDTVHWDSGPVTPTSADHWLKHPFRPSLNRTVHIYRMPPRALPARRGVARPIDRADPIVVYQTRSTDAGSVELQTDGTWAENDAIRALLADGAPLLLQQAGVGEGQLYISVDTAALALLQDQTGFLFNRNIVLPFDVVDRPPDTGAGPAGVTYADAATVFLTYEHLAAAEATYLDLAAAPG